MRKDLSAFLRPALRLATGGHLIVGSRGLLIAATIGLSALGCDIVEEVGTFTFCTDPRVFELDGDNSGIRVPSGSTLPVISCDSDSAPCDAGGIFCSDSGYPCEVACVAGNRGATCEATLLYQEALPVDISQQVDSQIKADVLKKVSLDRLEYDVTRNTLNTDTPAIDIYVGPSESRGISDNGVVRFARLPSIVAGSEFGTRIAETDPGGRDALTERVRDFKTPFNLLVGANLRFQGGSPLPTGAIDLTVRACFKANLL